MTERNENKRKSQTQTDGQKKENRWKRAEVIIPNILSFLAIILSLFAFWETQRSNEQMEIQRIKDNAEGYFKEQKYSFALMEYEKLKKLDPTDLSGYYNFTDEVKLLLLSDNPDCDAAKNYYQNYAKRLHNASDVEIDSLLEIKCK